MKIVNIILISLLLFNQHAQYVSSSNRCLAPISVQQIKKSIKQQILAHEFSYNCQKGMEKLFIFEGDKKNKKNSTVEKLLKLIDNKKTETIYFVGEKKSFEKKLERAKTLIANPMFYKNEKDFYTLFFFYALLNGKTIYFLMEGEKEKKIKTSDFKPLNYPFKAMNIFMPPLILAIIDSGLNIFHVYLFHKSVLISAISFIYLLIFVDSNYEKTLPDHAISIGFAIFCLLLLFLGYSLSPEHLLIHIIIPICLGFTMIINVPINYTKTDLMDTINRELYDAGNIIIIDQLNSGKNEFNDNIKNTKKTICSS